MCEKFISASFCLISLPFFLFLMCIVSCDLWPKALCMKPHNFHAALSTVRYLYLPREAFLYGVEIKTMNATYWAVVFKQGWLAGGEALKKMCPPHPPLRVHAGRVH